MGDDIIEASECLKAWERENLIPSDEIIQMKQMLRDLEEQAMS